MIGGVETPGIRKQQLSRRGHDVPPFVAGAPTRETRGWGKVALTTARGLVYRLIVTFANRKQADARVNDLLESGGNLITDLNFDPKRCV